MAIAELLPVYQPCLQFLQLEFLPMCYQHDLYSFEVISCRSMGVHWTHEGSGLWPWAQGPPGQSQWRDDAQHNGAMEARASLPAQGGKELFSAQSWGVVIWSTHWVIVNLLMFLRIVSIIVRLAMKRSGQMEKGFMHWWRKILTTLRWAQIFNSCTFCVICLPNSVRS